MATINVLLFMKDERYCAKVSDYFARVYKDEFAFIPAHTREFAVTAYGKLAEPSAPVVLMGEEFAENAGLPAGAVTACLVSSEDADAAENYYTFNKYQSGAKLREEILKLYNTALEKREAATPVFGEAATPAPAEAATPAPGEAATPAPAEAATPAPAEAATPAPGEAATPAPAEAATPALGEAATPALGEAATPAPGEAATPALGEVATPALGEVATPAPTRLFPLTEITVFTAATGGAGATTCALAFAKRAVKAGIKTLFLSFDYFGKVSLLFSGAGDDDSGISPLIDAITEETESGTDNDDSRDFSAVAKPLLRTDDSGLAYVGEASVPAHLGEITAKSAVYALTALIKAAAESGINSAVIDVPYLNREFWRVSADLADSIVVVSEKTSYSDSKFRRFADTVGIDDILNNTANVHKLKPLRNKVAAGLTLSADARGEVNGVPEIAKVVGARGDFVTVADIVSEADAWDKLG